MRLLIIAYVIGIAVGWNCGRLFEQSKHVTTPFGDVVPASEVGHIPVK